MGCADTSKGKVNGLTTLADGTGVCIGGNDGQNSPPVASTMQTSSLLGAAPSSRYSQTAPSRSVSSPTSLAASPSCSTRSSARAGATTRSARTACVTSSTAWRKNTGPSTSSRATRTTRRSSTACRAPDWVHQHFEIEIEVGGTIGYELYLGNTVTFRRNGDGGDINWGW
ncbi:hypothetical protein GLOTRDRAFT_100922 [Gloeophyllum trabeum ATCC 11539]|uniref:Uncharacterized protein n=1 Tax=Gloeophyllum trabeum (strain ATCC 11539 / FP-39264 / Madison 617) TaxID=670483 RepID=S7RGK7_GLOTA|nr:uncharacterized protein GLOTRDRAFT_100922 [Gloeophyllum trabeum ATCC 11539]EPQ53355.1 hypothetical protein GLOTRDRAFT_100922 [Gloeophyllum trabeum ATCC 11539]